MRYTIALAVIVCSCYASDDADALYKEGLEKLRASQSDHAMLVPATKLLAKAAERFEADGEEALAAEANSALYWARKRFTISDTTTLKGDAVVAKRLEVIAKPVAVIESQQWLLRADLYAKNHADDPLLIAIQYFAVADRFKDSDAGREAMDKSLKAMQAIAEKPNPVPTPQLVIAPKQPEASTATPVIDRKQKELTAAELDLTTLTPVSESVGWGNLSINKSIDEVHLPLCDGRRPKKYIGSCPPAVIIYDLPKGVRFFSSSGIRATRNDRMNDGVKFLVAFDGGKPVFESKEIKNIPDKAEMLIPIPPGAKTIELRVDQIKSITNDHAYWIEPKIIK